MKVLATTMIAILGLTVLPVPGAIAATNLVVNGNFEEPIVSAPELWDIYVSPVIPGWSVSWVDPGPVAERPDPALVELHRGVSGWLPYEGEQYSELDSDWDGPGGALLDEPASVKIYQTPATTIGRTYRLTFAFSPRPDTLQADNALGVYWEGALIDTITRDGLANTDWSLHQYDLVATVNGSEVAFADLGTANSRGTFLDDVILEDITPVTPGGGSKIEKIKIFNSKTAFVQNYVSGIANTGGNSAQGGEAKSAGNGGSVNGSEDDNTGGAGGAGGSGGAGGIVISGPAVLAVEIVNDINYDETSVEPACPCGEGSDIEKIIVKNFDFAVMGNSAVGIIDTGNNDVDGSQAGGAGDGGAVNDSEDGNLGGAGGPGGAGGIGGQIQTGPSASSIMITNKLNTIINKIKF